jgi:hypothetical protein
MARLQRGPLLVLPKMAIDVGARSIKMAQGWCSENLFG